MINNQRIPFFNYQQLFKDHAQEYLKIIEDVCERGAYIMGEELTLFEQKLSRYTGAKYAIGVADGTMALILGLMSVGIQKDDEVLVPSHTFIATAASVHHVGAKPVLVDCGRDHLIDPESVRKAITSRTRAIIPVQLNGRTANMDKILEISAQYDLKIVEDAAQALGSKFKEKMAGTFGDVGTFSFYPSKTLGGFGDGGAIVTNDEHIAYKIRALRDHGRSESGEIIGWGFNARLDNLQAAILSFKLDVYPESIQKRRNLAAIYHERLKEIKQLILPVGPDEQVNHYDIYQNYEIEAENREELIKYLRENGINTIIQWGGNCIHQFPALKLSVNVPYTEKMSKSYMLLPLNPVLIKQEIEYICDKIIKFYIK